MTPPRRLGFESYIRPAPLALALAAAAAVVALPACAPSPPHRTPHTRPAQATVPTPPLLGSPPSAGGMYVDVGPPRPLTGDALARAKMSRARILRSVQAFTAGDLAAAPATQPETQPAESPPQAVKYYLQGRALFLDGSNTEAMEALEKALALDPNAFTVLRLMGRVSFAASQLARGSVYLQRAYRINPADMEVNYLLGRYWLERRDNDRAIFYLMGADHAKTRGEAQAPLVSFYLARALQQARYYAAAADTLDEFLAEAALPVPGYRYDRELSYLLEQQWAGELEAAENDVQVGDWTRAIRHYQRALADQPDDAFIASHLLNAQVHAGIGAAGGGSTTGLAQAKKNALAFVTATSGSDDALTLLVWAYRAAGDSNALIPDVRHALAGADDARRAQVLAAAYDAVSRPQDAFDTLREYLSGHPRDLAMLGMLLKRARSVPEFDAALHAAGAALAADPADPDPVLKLFRSAADTDAAAAWAAQPHPASDLGDAPFLAAQTLVLHDGPPAAIDAAFLAGLKGAGPVVAARQAYIGWLIGQERFADAQTRIDRLIAAGDQGPEPWKLRIALEVGEQRLTAAQASAVEAAKRFPDDHELQLRLAALDRVRGEDAASDRVLTTLIDADPTYTPAYEALINSFLERVRQPGPAGGQKALSDAVAWLGRLVAAVPSSLFGQITTATLYNQVGRSEEAVAMMAKLAADHPDEPDVEVALARARQADGQPAQAAAGLEAALAADPSPDLVAGLAQLYRTQNRTADAVALVERMAKAHPHLPAYALAAEAELDAQKKPDQAIAVLQAAALANPRSQIVAMILARRLADAGRAREGVAALESFIQRNGPTAQRVYELSHLYARAGQDDQAEAALQRVLQLLPTHTGAANDLGFYWADAGTHLDQAETLIKQALEQEPANGAYLDSLGWVYYKQGKFADALTYLQKAMQTPDGESPEVIGHAGDALYRAGRIPEATERWHQAQAAINAQEPPLDRDDAALKTYLDRVLTALGSGKTPDVTPTAEAGAPRAASR